MSALKHWVVGRPLATDEDAEQRLPKRIGLAVFASDAISSTAYATEEILIILVPVAGLAALHLLMPISLVVVFVLAIVATSYRQTIHAYPNGGGAYVVARDNLNRSSSLVAGASLLVDYTLTVAVSVSAGVAAVVSAFPSLADHRVSIGVAVVAFVAYANLRGAKESGTLFAVPTYLYIVALGLLVGYGLFGVHLGELEAIPVDEDHLRDLTGGSISGLVGMSGALIMARAFSSGAVALTGTEAIANGAPSFRPPESHNAARTLVMMAAILGFFFFAISLLADVLQPLPSDDETVLSQMGRAVFGGESVAYFFVQFTTMGILFLAANTAFAGFPRLASLMARDGFLPRQLAHRGDRLVYSNGILLVAGFACLLLVAFGGITTALIPLYAVGVFTGFTISQVGMIRHHRRLREPGWRRGQAINVVGAMATGTVLVVVIVSKFTSGAWIPVVVIPAIVLVFRAIKAHYERLRATLRIPDGWRPNDRQHTVIILVSRVHRGVAQAISWSQSLRPDHLHALHVAASADEAGKVRGQWEKYAAASGLTLDVIEDPFRRLTVPVIEYIDRLDERSADDIVTVVLPEFVVSHWWEQLLHNQSGAWLKHRLRHRPNTVVVSVPLQLGDVDGDRVRGLGAAPELGRREEVRQ
ncbi:MAG: APC family permease [Nitriliruptorales bacterium]|nr:APC family permease [Nitriliruptorales bacterium]